jgi:N-acetylneuraminic acid mutarotase
MTTLRKMMATGTMAGRKQLLMGGALTHSTKLADMPGILNQHGFEELNGLLYAVAGETTVISSNSCYAYDPIAGTWATKASLPILVESPVLRAVNGKLYCIGGLVSELTVTADVYEYDPGANTWTKKASMPTPREDMGSAVVDGKIYVFGGLTTNNTPTKVLEIYDPATDEWTTGAPLPDFKHFGDFGCALNGMIYAIGSSNTFANYPLLHPVTACYRYNPVTNVWSTIASIPVSTCYKEVVPFNGMLYVVSGCTDSSTTYTNLIQAYHPGRNQWITCDLPAPYEARGIGLAVYNGELYMSGGAWFGAQKYFWKLSTSPLGSELVYNGGFELGNPPLSWAPLWQPATLTAVADARPRSSGTKCLDISPSSASGAGDANIALATQAGKTYFLDVWLKLIAGATAINLIIYSAAYAVLVNVGTTSSEWDNIQASFLCPTDGCIAVFTVTGAQNQHGRADDFSTNEIL